MPALDEDPASLGLVVGEVGGTGRRLEQWQLVLLVDQSGSMAGSVIHSAVTAACLWGLPGLKTQSVFNVVLASVLIPAPMFALPLFLLMAKLDITNSYWSVLLPSCVSPFGVHLCRIFAAASVPDELLGP